ncbi:hypothetical protein PV328_009539 [Microctonus aethiopoides]|uniref:Methyltransferase type 11 domain-containing protein n=1 Tax=Microctonus aethiopoides TaxID=144406 RepID=A0AA39EZA0_9HYME|nr:hypothetical protein PV328_009539 [Microctonus aethiopoides]
MNMSENNIISLEDAKKQLNCLMERLSKSNREELLSDAIQTWSGIKFGVNSGDDDEFENDEDTMDDPVATLNSIAKEIRERVPLDAIFPSETIIIPSKGENSNCCPNTTVHVDAFLYDDDEVDDLEKEGKLKRYYCRDCGSKNIEPLIFISNSVSREDLYHIFNTLLPTLDGKIVLDVGSRLGAVLYGAYVYTDAARIIGVEMNKDLCDLQNEVVKKFKMSKRIEILHKRIENAADVLASADVIVLNNAFEFYLSESEQIKVWQFLKANIKRGAFIISRPRIAIALSNLKTNIKADEWVKEVTEDSTEKKSNLFNMESNKNVDQFTEIICYKVL